MNNLLLKLFDNQKWQQTLIKKQVISPSYKDICIEAITYAADLWRISFVGIVLCCKHINPFDCSGISMPI